MKPSTVKINPMPSRFKHQVPKYKVARSNACINCSTCAKSCPHGVHERLEGHNKVRPPIDYKCIGFECSKNDYYCVARCPRNALSISLNPMYEPYEVHINDIREIWKFVHYISDELPEPVLPEKQLLRTVASMKQDLYQLKKSMGRDIEDATEL